MHISWKLMGLMVVSSGLLAGCASSSEPREPESGNQVMQSVTAVGVLRGGMMGIGGESTGWRLESSEREQSLELDVSRVRQAAEGLAGMKVRATGRMTTVEYVERGATQVLQVESLTKVR